MSAFGRKAAIYIASYCHRLATLRQSETHGLILRVWNNSRISSHVNNLYNNIKYINVISFIIHGAPLFQLLKHDIPVMPTKIPQNKV